MAEEIIKLSQRIKKLEGENRMKKGLFYSVVQVCLLSILASKMQEVANSHNLQLRSSLFLNKLGEIVKI